MQTIYLGNYINLRTQLDVSCTVTIIRVLITTFKTFKVYVQRKWSHLFSSVQNGADTRAGGHDLQGRGQNEQVSDARQKIEKKCKGQNKKLNRGKNAQRIEKKSCSRLTSNLCRSLLVVFTICTSILSSSYNYGAPLYRASFAHETQRGQRLEQQEISYIFAQPDCQAFNQGPGLSTSRQIQGKPLFLIPESLSFIQNYSYYIICIKEEPEHKALQSSYLGKKTLLGMCAGTVKNKKIFSFINCFSNAFFD